MDEIYKFMGYDYGTFTARETGEVRNYCTIYVMSKLGARNGSYRDGFKADKFSCVSPDAFKGIEPEDNVRLHFNQYKRVTLVEKVK